MATYSVQIAKHAALGANTEDTVNLAGPCRTVQVVNWGAVTDIISIRIGPSPGQFSAGPAATTAPPADDDFQLRGAGGSPVAQITFEAPAFGGVTVRLKSAQTPSYSVQGIPAGVR